MGRRLNGVCAAMAFAALISAALPAWAQEQIVWQTDIAKAVAQAKAEKKLVLVHFYGDSCPPCKTVEQKVFPQPKVVQAVMRNYVPVKINVDKEDKIASRFGIRSIPTDVFLSAAGQEFHRNLTTPSATDYVSLLDQLAIQTGIGGARQAALHERESQYDSRQPAEEQPPPAPQQYVQNQFAPQNRYSNPSAQAAAETGPPQIAAAPSSEGPMVYGGWGGAATERELPQNGPYGQQREQPQTNSGALAGNSFQGSNYVAPSQQSTQRATFQDPGDITARQPIRNQFIEVKNAPPVGLDGYCPVSLRAAGTWRKGDRQFGAVHRGRTYLFASADEQQKFLADPDAYSPVLSGADPVIFAEQGQIVEGNRNFGISLPSGNRAEMYFFASSETRDRFEKNPKQYAINAHQAMLRSETERKFR